MLRRIPIYIYEFVFTFTYLLLYLVYLFTILFIPLCTPGHYFTYLIIYLNIQLFIYLILSPSWYLLAILFIILFKVFLNCIF